MSQLYLGFEFKHFVFCDGNAICTVIKIDFDSRLVEKMLQTYQKKFNSMIKESFNQQDFIKNVNNLDLGLPKKIKVAG